MYIVIQAVRRVDRTAAVDTTDKTYTFYERVKTKEAKKRLERKKNTSSETKDRKKCRAPPIEDVADTAVKNDVKKQYHHMSVNRVATAVRTKGNNRQTRAYVYTVNSRAPRYYCCIQRGGPALVR